MLNVKLDAIKIFLYLLSSGLIPEQELCKPQVVFSCLQEDFSVFRLTQVSIRKSLGYIKFESLLKAYYCKIKIMRGSAIVDLILINK